MHRMDTLIPEWNLADRLRKARTITGLNQAEFADEVGISRRSVTNYENADTTPNKAVLNQWALRTGVDLDWLRYGIAVIDYPDGPGTQGEPSPGWVTAGENGSFGLYLVGQAA